MPQLGTFNWINLINAIPAIVAGTQQLMQGQPGATKKQQVLSWIGLDEGIAATADPALAPVLQFANQQIDLWVNVFHHTNAPGFGTNSVPATSPAA